MSNGNTTIDRQEVMAPHFIAMPGTPEWGAARSSGFGASQAAAVCGLSEYETSLHVYLRARGELEPVEENTAMRMGTKLEPVIISEFVHTTGLAVSRYPCPMYRHPDPELHFMLATPDAELESGDLLEAKSMGWRVAKLLGEEGSDFIPDRWVLQCQQQMEVTGRDRVHVAALIDGRTLRGYMVERNDVLIARMIEMERELWQRIIDGNPPEPTWGHASTSDLIKEMHGLSTGKTVILGADVAELWKAQGVLAAEEKAAKESRDDLRAKILHAMGDAEIAIFESGESGPIDLQLSRSEVQACVVQSFTRKAYITLREINKTPKRKR